MTYPVPNASSDFIGGSHPRLSAAFAVMFRIFSSSVAAEAQVVSRDIASSIVRILWGVAAIRRIIV
jgi:hypothetical protein